MTNTLALALLLTANATNMVDLADGARFLSATVNVTTNVVHWNNEERTPFADVWVWPGPQPGSVTKEATERTESTEVVETKTLRIVWEGKEHTITHERVISRSMRRWVRRDSWVEECVLW